MRYNGLKKEQKNKVKIRSFADFKAWVIDLWDTFLLKLGPKIGTGKNTERTWKKIRPVSIYIISGVLVLIILTISISSVFSSLFSPVSHFNKSPVLFNINSGASMSYVATKLEEAGLIKSSFGIKLLADFTSVSSKIQSGEYILDRTMSPQDILDIITKPTASSKVELRELPLKTLPRFWLTAALFPQRKIF